MIIAYLSPPRLWPARFWKRFAKCFANAPPWVRARGAHCKTVCTRSVSNPSARPLARGLRGAPANEMAFALPEGPHSTKALRQWIHDSFALGPCAAVLQCAPRARTKGRGMLRIRQSASKDVPATGADRERPSASRMPFPHQRQGNASHKAKRFQRRAGHGRGQGKNCDYHFPFIIVGEALTRERHTRSTILSQATGCERIN